MIDLVTALRTDSAMTRWQAIERYRRSPDSPANAQNLSALREALNDDHPFVRWQAGLALAQQPEGIRKLAEAVRTDDQAIPAQLAAIDALGCSQSAEAEALLKDALHHNAALVRQSAAEALVNRKSSQAAPHLIQALHDPDPWVRRAAAYALGFIDQPGAVAALLKGLGDRSALVRRSAAHALGMLRAKSALPYLKVSLTDQDTITRRNAAWAIGRLGLIEALPVLNQLIDDPDLNEEVKTAARNAAKSLSRPRWLQALLGVRSQVRGMNA